MIGRPLAIASHPDDGWMSVELVKELPDGTTEIVWLRTPTTRQRLYVQERQIAERTARGVAFRADGLAAPRVTGRGSPGTAHPTGASMQRARIVELLRGGGAWTTKALNEALGISITTLGNRMYELEIAGDVERVADPGGSIRAPAWQAHLRLTG